MSVLFPGMTLIMGHIIKTGNQINQGAFAASGRTYESRCFSPMDGKAIYIFDDSFSALDYKTDRVLRKMLKQETGTATTLIVAQRIGTIMDADKIIA